MAGGNTELAAIDNVNTELNVMTQNLYGIENLCEIVGYAFKAAFNTVWIKELEIETNICVQNIQKIEYNLNDVNKSLEEAGEKTDKLSKADDKIGKMFKAAAGYISKIDVSKILNASDELVQSTAKLNMMNDDLLTTDQLTQKIYTSAQNARGSFLGMTDFVTQMGMNSGDSFGSVEEIITFGNLLQKQMTIAGTSTEEASERMSQLAESSEKGVLGGDELSNIFEKMPNMVQSVAEYLDKPVETVKAMASEGEITTNILKNSMFAATEEINEKFGEMPMTWNQIWQTMKDTALYKFQPILQKVNDVANSAPFQAIISGATIALGVIASIVGTVFGVFGTIANCVYDNWSMISPVIYTVLAVLMGYVAYLGILKAAEIAGTATKIVSCLALYAYAAVTKKVIDETAAATAAEKKFNTTLLSSPITWITLLIIGVVVALVMFANYMAKTTEGVSTGFGVICGWVNVGIQFFKNLGLEVANIALGIWNSLGACADNIGIAFGNAISSIKAWFFDLLASGLMTVAKIAEALNKLPFVEIDYSGIVEKADEFAAKAEEVAANKQEYRDVGAAFDEGYHTFETFEDGWKDKAFAEGAAWGDEKYGKFSDWLSSFGEKTEDSTVFAAEEYVSEQTDIEDNTAQIADNTASIKDSVDISNENLKYLRDIAERDAVNRFTTAQIKVAMTNNNNINNSMDLDGIINHLVNGVNEAMVQSAEGVNAYA